MLNILVQTISNNYELNCTKKIKIHQIKYVM